MPRDIGALIDSQPLRPLQWRVLLLCSLTVLLDGYDIQTMALAVPALAGEWQLPPSGFGLALSAALLGIGIGSALIAPLGDRWGRRPLILGGLCLVGLGSIASAYAGNLDALIAMRFATGLGLAASLANATALVSEYVPARRRAALVTLMFVNVGLGAFLAGFTAPALMALGGWRGIFFAGGLLPLGLALIMLAALPESVRLLLARRPGHPAIARLLARLAPGVEAGTVVAEAIVAGQPLRGSLGELLSHAYRPRTLLLWSLFCGNLFVLYLLISWLPTLLHQAGWAPAQALRCAVLIQLGGIVGGLAIAFMVDKGRAVPALVCAYGIATCALAAFLVVPPDPAAWSALLLLLGCGVSGTQFALYALGAAAYPTTIRATGLGWAVAVGRTGAIAGPLAGAFLLQQQIASATLLGLLALPLLLCAFAARSIPRLLPFSQPTVPEGK